jgi:hypothetical protein
MRLKLHEETGMTRVGVTPRRKGSLEEITLKTMGYPNLEC